MDKTRTALATLVSRSLADAFLLIYRTTGERTLWFEITTQDGTEIRLEEDKWDFRFRFTFPDQSVMRSSWFNYTELEHVQAL